MKHRKSQQRAIKNKIKVLYLNCAIIEINPMSGLKRKMEGAEDRIHELEDRAIENAQSEQQREKIYRKKKRTDTKGFVGL